MSASMSGGNPATHTEGDHAAVRLPAAPAPLQLVSSPSAKGSGQRLDGKAIAAKLTAFITRSAQRLPRKPGLAVVLVGEDPASQIYVGRKQKLAAQAGFAAQLVQFPAEAASSEVLAAIDRLNRDSAIDGIMLQLPVPAHLSRETLLAAIAPDKDADGLTPWQAGRLAQGRADAVIPCTARGCLLLLRHVGIELAGKRALVIGRSELVGRPLGLLLLAENCTLTFAHSKTRDLPQLAAEADILAVAAGKAGMVAGAWVKRGAVVLDVGIHRTEDGLCGDVQFEAAEQRARWITPVPGGVGPMTVACLLLNTLELACRHLGQPLPQLAEDF